MIISINLFINLSVSYPDDVSTSSWATWAAMKSTSDPALWETAEQKDR